MKEWKALSLTSRAFESAIPWFPYILTLTVFLFAYSTMIAWFYYGLKGLTYVSGENTAVIMSYKIVFCLFVVVGSSMQLDAIIGFSDAMIFAMAIPNVYCTLFVCSRIEARH